MTTVSNSSSPAPSPTCPMLATLGDVISRLAIFSLRCLRMIVDVSVGIQFTGVLQTRWIERSDDVHPALPHELAAHVFHERSHYHSYCFAVLQASQLRGSPRGVDVSHGSSHFYASAPRLGFAKGLLKIITVCRHFSRRGGRVLAIVNNN